MLRAAAVRLRVPRRGRAVPAPGPRRAARLRPRGTRPSSGWSQRAWPCSRTSCARCCRTTTTRDGWPRNACHFGEFFTALRHRRRPAGAAGRCCGGTAITARPAASTRKQQVPAGYGPGGTDAVTAGCCGLAGSWGFEQGKYDISMDCGEQALLARGPSRRPGHPGRRRRLLLQDADRGFGRRAARPAYGRGHAAIAALAHGPVPGPRRAVARTRAVPAAAEAPARRVMAVAVPRRPLSPRRSHHRPTLALTRRVQPRSRRLALIRNRRKEQRARRSSLGADRWIRACDQDRDRVARCCSDAYAVGRLTRRSSTASRAACSARHGRAAR